MDELEWERSNNLNESLRAMRLPRDIGRALKRTQSSAFALGLALCALDASDELDQNAARSH